MYPCKSIYHTLKSFLNVHFNFSDHPLRTNLSLSVFKILSIVSLNSTPLYIQVSTPMPPNLKITVQSLPNKSNFRSKWFQPLPLITTCSAELIPFFFTLKRFQDLKPAFSNILVISDSKAAIQNITKSLYTQNFTHHSFHLKCPTVPHAFSKSKFNFTWMQRPSAIPENEPVD